MRRWDTLSVSSKLSVHRCVAFNAFHPFFCVVAIVDELAFVDDSVIVLCRIKGVVEIVDGQETIRSR
jgi:hypothetical protein